MSLSLIIVLTLMLAGLGCLIFFSSAKHSSPKSSLINDRAAPLLFSAPLLSWLIYVKYNQVEASLFNSWPYAAMAVMLGTIALVFVNFKK